MCAPRPPSTNVLYKTATRPAATKAKRPPTLFASAPFEELVEVEDEPLPVRVPEEKPD